MHRLRQGTEARAPRLQRVRVLGAHGRGGRRQLGGGGAADKFPKFFRHRPQGGLGGARKWGRCKGGGPLTTNPVPLNRNYCSVDVALDTDDDVDFALFLTDDDVDILGFLKLVILQKFCTFDALVNCFFGAAAEPEFAACAAISASLFAL